MSQHGHGNTGENNERRAPDEHGIRANPPLVLSWPDLGWRPSLQDCSASLRDRGLTQYEFGFVWLMPEGVGIAIQELGLDRKDMAA
jgi:hypothetical protein